MDVLYCPYCGHQHYPLSKDEYTCPLCQSSFKLEFLGKPKPYTVICTWAGSREYAGLRFIHAINRKEAFKYSGFAGSPTLKVEDIFEGHLSSGLTGAVA